MADQNIVKDNVVYNWRTVLVIPHKIIYEKVRDMCLELEKENKKFKYHTPNKTRGKGPQYQVWIYSINRQQAYERGDYFHQKFGIRYYVNARR